MALPDFVNETLTFLDTNWNTSNAPKPVLIDGDEMRRFDNDQRAKSEAAYNENLLTVDASPPGTNTPLGTEYDHAIRHGVSVEIEAYHTDGGGQVADKDAFDNITTEAQRSLLVNRTYPLASAGEYGIKDLFIEEVNDESAASGDAHYFRYMYTVWYEGFEDLP